MHIWESAYNFLKSHKHKKRAAKPGSGGGGGGGGRMGNLQSSIQESSTSRSKPSPNHFVHHFGRKRYPLRISLIKRGSPFTYCHNWPVS